MKRILLSIIAGIMLASCEVPIVEINRWWREDVLKHAEEEEPATVTIELAWPKDDE